MIPVSYIVILVFLLGMFGALFLGNAVAAQNFLEIGMTLGLFCLPFISTERLLFFFVALSASALTFPGVPAPLDVSHLILGSLLILTIVNVVLRGGFVSMRPDFIWLLGSFLLCWLVLTASLRGWSLHSLGGSTQGGTLYIFWILNVLAIFVVRANRMHPNFWRVAMALYFLGSLIPTLSEIGADFGITALQGFIQNPNAATQDTVDLSDPTHRFAYLGTTGVSLFCCLIFLVPLRVILSPRGWWTWPLLLFLLVMTGYGGFRNCLIGMALFFFIQLIMERLLTIVRVLALVFIFAMCYLFLYQYSLNLPWDFQRCISDLPGISVDPSVRANADDSVEWRLGIWKEAAKDIPTYALVGKGFTYSKNDIDKLKDLPGDNSMQMFIVMNSYHNGPLSLILTLGVPGLLAVTLLLLSVARKHIRYARLQSHDLPPRWRHLHRSMLSYYLALIISYFFIYGDIYGAIVPALLMTGFLESAWKSILVANDKRMQAEDGLKLAGNDWRESRFGQKSVLNRTR